MNLFSHQVIGWGLSFRSTSEEMILFIVHGVLAEIAKNTRTGSLRRKSPRFHNRLVGHFKRASPRRLNESPKQLPRPRCCCVLFSQKWSFDGPKRRTALHTSGPDWTLWNTRKLITTIALGTVAIEGWRLNNSKTMIFGSYGVSWEPDSYHSPDNWAELASTAVLNWVQKIGIDWHYINPAEWT